MGKPYISTWKVHPDLSTLFPPLTKMEYEELQRSIKLEGCRDEITVAGGFVIDGHNRLTICQALGIEFRVCDRSESLKTEADRKMWMLNRQLGRRNLKPADASRLRAELVALYKANGKLASAGRYGKQPGQKDMDELGAELGVSGRQLRDDVKRASSKPEPAKPEPTSGLESKPEATAQETPGSEAERDVEQLRSQCPEDKRRKFDELVEKAIKRGLTELRCTFYRAVREEVDKRLPEYSAKLRTAEEMQLRFVELTRDFRTIWTLEEYRKMRSFCHPDRFAGTDQEAKANEATELLNRLERLVNKAMPIEQKRRYGWAPPKPTKVKK